jgi:hypothetical protein
MVEAIRGEKVNAAPIIAQYEAATGAARTVGLAQANTARLPDEPQVVLWTRHATHTAASWSSVRCPPSISLPDARSTFFRDR